jgi:acetyltransferase-like isoleucine patch superfamily enzyme
MRERLGTLFQLPRIAKFRALSSCRNVRGSATILQPLLLLGRGSILLGDEVVFGYPASIAFHSGYCHLEAVTPESVIEIGDRAEINNNAYFKSEGPGISIGADALVGSNVTIYDSDFHELHPARRRGGRPAMALVQIGRNVFIGDGVRILKGVTIGDDSVIGAGSVVSSRIPGGVIAAGNPARVIREIEDAGELRGAPAHSGSPVHMDAAARFSSQ